MKSGAAGALVLSALAALSGLSGASAQEGAEPPAAPPPVVEAPAERPPEAAAPGAEAPGAGAPPPAARRVAVPREATPPPPRPDGPAPRPSPAARMLPLALPPTTTVPEPDGYRGEPYRSPAPATLRGAEVVGDPAAHALWRAGVVFLDLLPTPVKPANLPPGTLWRDPPHATIPGALWLANTGYDALDPETERYFFAALDRASGGRRDAPLVFFCKQDCWMSWNGARRAVAAGYARVFWYPGGTDGWTANGWPLDPVKPYAPEAEPPAP